MVCSKCGAQLPNDAVFCNNCGANLKEQAQPQQAQPQPQPQPQAQQAQPQQQAQQAKPQFQQAQPQQQAQQQQYQQPQQQYQQQQQYQYQQPVRPQIIQPKAKSGLAVGVVGAALFFLAMLNDNFFGIDVWSILPVAALAAFVLVKEEDIWLRKCAVRAVGTVIMFSVLSVLIGLFFDFIGIFRIFSSWDVTPIVFARLTDIQTILLYIARGLQNVFLLIMGISACGMRTVKMPIVDGLIDKHMN